MYREIKECRAGGGEVETLMTLGVQAMSGTFPKPNEDVEYAPLELVWSDLSGLLQLKHTCDLKSMYGMNYGYRSGLNKSMVRHLQSKAQKLKHDSSNTILDIGSNDGTLLRAFEHGTRIGMDPTGEKFQEYYPPGVTLVKDFFSKKKFFDVSPRKADIITSIAMFYDLENPIAFAEEVAECLADDGVWHLEQSYMPKMLQMNCYDTICHEHLEYYSLTAIKRILELAGLYIHNVSVNDINGGSFAIDVKHTVPEYNSEINWMLVNELNLKTKIKSFGIRAVTQSRDLISLLSRLRSNDKKVFAYGASTKGNVTLQYCGINNYLVQYALEVNEDKFGHVTPGSYIPIISETDGRAMKPDYMLVLPWHFKAGIIEREKHYLEAGGKLIFPFPYVEIVGA